jgi:outer membrane lipoprotein-sorting protein
MVSLDEIVPLIYRASQDELSLSARVTQRMTSTDANTRHSKYCGTIQVAPGGRYRVELIDEDGDLHTTLSDGNEWWEIIDGKARRLTIPATNAPFAELLVPGWLLAGYSIAEVSECQTGERQAYRFDAVPRAPLDGRTEFRHDYTRVRAVLDKDLGILLRCETFSKNGKSYLTELSDLILGLPDAEDGDSFTLPTDVTAVDDADGTSSIPTVTPMRTSPSQALTDSEVNLLYRTDMPSPEFFCVVREESHWSIAVEALREAVEAAPRPFSNFANWPRPWEALARQRPSDSVKVAELQVSVPGRYRITFRGAPPTEPHTLVSDGNRLSRIYEGKTVVRSTGPLPFGIGIVADPAWLLDGFHLSAAGAETIDSRQGIRFVAIPAVIGDKAASGPLSHVNVIGDRIEATVDRALGIVLRLAVLYREQLVLLSELSEVTEKTTPTAFRIEDPTDPVRRNPIDRVLHIMKMAKRKLCDRHGRPGGAGASWGLTGRRSLDADAFWQAGRPPSRPPSTRSATASHSPARSLTPRLKPRLRRRGARADQPHEGRPLPHRPPSPYLP